MAETVASSAIIPEVLNNKDNYEDWSIRIQTCLEAQDLWDVIESNDKASEKHKSEAEIKAWKKKNVTALHTIYVYCGRDAFKTIREIKYDAKSAWETLKAEFGSPVVEESSKSPDDNFQYQPLFEAVKKNDWSYTQQYHKEHPEALRSSHPISRQTALHIAVLYEHEQLVKELIQIMSEEDQEIKDTEGFTAFLLAVHQGKTSIAECMAKKNPKILGIAYRTEGTQILPVTLAFAKGNIKFGRYLYSITLKEYLLAEEGFPGAALLVYSMQAEQYDIALDLLQNCPGLTISRFMFKVDDITIAFLEDILATFPTESPFNFWQQWIFNRTNIHLATGNTSVDVSNSEASQATRRRITGLLKQFAFNAHKLLGLLSATLKTLLGIKHLYKKKLAKTCWSKVLERICNEIKTLDEEQLRADSDISNAIILATTNGVVEFVRLLTQANPRVLSSILDKETDRTMLMIAIQYRQEKIVSLFNNNKEFKDITAGEDLVNFTDKSGNNPLHLTGLLPPSSYLNIIPGPALQMQQELRWFQEVESLMENKILKITRNDEGMTAQEYFTKNHEELRKEGEKWMKETAHSYSVVATLILTIMFAAGFIVPGVSLLSSTTSVLIFLGILTSRYYEEAFLTSLPTKLILGMSALFFSIASMMLCFCAALYEMLQGQLEILIPIILLAIVPVSLFIILQSPLLFDIIISTYGYGLGIAPKKDKKCRFFW